jgi:hypothetical protein
MSEEKQEQPQPKQSSVKDQVSVLIKAYELAGIASDVRTVVNEKSRLTIILYNEGRDKAENPTLAYYIELAEKQFLRQHSKEIIEVARGELKKEIESIKELVNG